MPEVVIEGEDRSSSINNDINAIKPTEDILYIRPTASKKLIKIFISIIMMFYVDFFILNYNFK